MKNEKTSPVVAKIAGRILKNLNGAPDKDLVIALCPPPLSLCTVAELKALAASALTQAADKKKP